MNKAKTAWMSKYMMATATKRPITIPGIDTVNWYLKEVGTMDMSSEDHTIEYVTIGNNVINGVLADSFVSPPRNSKLGILYGHLPFLMVEVDDDTIVVDEEMYGCKVRLALKDGRSFYGYFSKKVSVGEAVVSNTGLDGYNTTPNDTPLMSPILPNLMDDPVLVTTHHPVPVPIDLENLKACKLYAEQVLGNVDLANIREIGLCAGNDHKGLILLSSTNIGGIEGIKEPKLVKLTIGLSSVVRSTGGWAI